MKLSRRRALQVTGGLIAGGLAGCVERRVTERRTRIDRSTSWQLSPQSDAERDEDAFESYVEEMEGRYGESGVWGIESDRRGEFVAAFTHQFAPETPRPDDTAAATLDPQPVDSEAAAFVQDACVAIYRTDDDRYRHWLWVAASTDQRPGLELDLVNLTAGVRLTAGDLQDGAAFTAGDGESVVSLADGQAGRFPRVGGTVESDTDLETDRYLVTWNGSREGAQSVNGICEERRTGEYGLVWDLSVGVEFVEQE